MIYGEFMMHMTRLAAVFSLFLLSCSLVIAQNPAPVPAAAPVQPAAASAESPEIREFQKIEDAWSGAINERDQYSLELVLSPLFVDVSAVGDITTRNQQLAQLITARFDVWVIVSVEPDGAPTWTVPACTELPDGRTTAAFAGSPGPEPSQPSVRPNNTQRSKRPAGGRPYILDRADMGAPTDCIDARQELLIESQSRSFSGGERGLNQRQSASR